jgi:hypothetical protein
MPEPLYALTLWQPWADLIVDGLKPVENRPWAPPSWLLGKPFAIHAGRTYDRECEAACFAGRFSPDGTTPIAVSSEGARGAIIGIATLDRVEWRRPLLEPSSESPWFFGPCGWWLRDVTRIRPVPCRGFQKLWKVEGETLDLVREAYREALRRERAA